MPSDSIVALPRPLLPGRFQAMSHGTSDFHSAEVTGAAASARDAVKGFPPRPLPLIIQNECILRAAATRSIPACGRGTGWQAAHGALRSRC